MCGICGIVDPSGSPRLENLKAMASVLRHRGPDDEGYLVEGPMGFGHRRLSIIDLDHGRQPLSNEDGTVHVVFNGEIYNHRELRAELTARGHKLATESDTEVIVHLYEELGERCVERLRGMFAFAIWDVKRQRLVLARDRLGQKPLFYASLGDRFVFGSEVKAVLALPGMTTEPDLLSLHSYLTLRFVPSPRTMFRGVSAVPPAHVLTLEDGQIKLTRYWGFSYRPKFDEPEEVLIDRLAELLEETIRCHLVSDVPLGTFLSGGIDSALITALTARELGPGLPTFSIGSESPDFNELPLARIVSERYQTSHHEEIARPDLITLLPEMVHHLDMPGDPIAACQYHVARLAAKHVTVALGGDGGDELFGGYDRFVGFGLIDYYAALPKAVRTRVVGPVLDRLVDSFTYKSFASKVRWMHTLSFASGGERYADATAYFRFGPKRLDDLYGAELSEAMGKVDPREPLIQAFEATDADHLLDRMLNADATTRLPEHLLILFDRMTMAHSLEGRSPFLDHEVAEFATRLPPDLKIKGRRLKYLSRRVAERYVPKEITTAPKRGFMFPIAYWIQNELHDATNRFLIDESRFVERGWFREDSLRRIMEEHVSGRVDHHHRIWMLLNLEIWHRLFLEGTSVHDVSDDLRGAMSHRAHF